MMRWFTGPQAPPSSATKVPQSATHHALNSLIGQLQNVSDVLMAEHVALTQYSLKRGLETYGKAG